MGFWSRLKKIAKSVITNVIWRPLKAAVRIGVRLGLELFFRSVNLLATLFGFGSPPAKNITIHICILTKANGRPVVRPTNLDLLDQIEHAKTILKDKFNVNLKPYSKSFVEVLPGPAPDYALNVNCGFDNFIDELGMAGEYFARNSAGWAAVPISLRFPITVFIVEEIMDGAKIKAGCSPWIFGDYIFVPRTYIGQTTTLIHEIGHSCGQFWHSEKGNYMANGGDAGDEVTYFQKQLLRGSRHVTFW
jgi:hypothetical protein